VPFDLVADGSDGADVEAGRVGQPKMWGVRGIDGPVRAIVDVTVDTVIDTRSRLPISVDFEGRGIGKLLVALVVRGHLSVPPAPGQRR
jgi:hypothetical protein